MEAHRQAISLRGKGLCIERGPLTICKHLNFVLPAGSLLEVLGDNGAGKTSLLRLIVGLSQPAAGHVHWQNLPNGRPPPMTYIAHKLAIKAALTVRQNLSDCARLHGQHDDAVVHHALKFFDLLPVADVLCAEISEGQRRKTALSRLLVERSKLWVLDEPTASLDQASVTRLEEIISQHLQAQGLVVIATHRLLNVPTVAKQTIRLGE